MLQNVFFIDDDKPTTVINERLAKRSKLFKHVKTFNSSKLALDYLQSIQNDIDLLPCIIFSDINMPTFSGWDFLNEFNKIDFPKKIYIIMLSSSDMLTSDFPEQFKNIIHTFERKPLTVEKITKHVQQICL